MLEALFLASFFQKWCISFVPSFLKQPLFIKSLLKKLLHMSRIFSVNIKLLYFSHGDWRHSRCEVYFGTTFLCLFQLLHILICVSTKCERVYLWEPWQCYHSEGWFPRRWRRRTGLPASRTCRANSNVLHAYPPAGTRWSRCTRSGWIPQFCSRKDIFFFKPRYQITRWQLWLVFTHRFRFCLRRHVDNSLHNVGSQTAFFVQFKEVERGIK